MLSYEDRAVGVMSRNEAGKLWISRITLHPSVAYGANAATPEEEARLHGLAHEECFIAQSIRTEVRIASRGAR